MTRPDVHLPYEELAAGHALSALEPEEEQQFLQHLVGCARCERDVAEHRATLAHLAYAPEAAEPPPALLEGIRAGVRASGREATFPSDRGPSVPVASSEAQPAEVSSLDQARRRRDAGRLSRAGRWTGVAAAAALVLGLGVWNTVLQRDRTAQDELGGRLAAAVQDLADADTQKVPLAAPDGDVVAVALVRDDELSIVVDGLAPNSADTTYVLWAQGGDGSVRPVGAFDVTSRELDVLEGVRLEDGSADLTTDVTALHVSREKGDEAPAQPASAVLASGEA